MRAIFWDLMDTLLRDPFFTHVADHLGLSFERLLQEKDPNAWTRFELGEIDEAELFRCFFRDRREFDGPGLKRHMLEAFEWIDGVEPILAELRARGVPMYALSNYPCWVHDIDAKLGLSRYLELRFVSCDTGVRKPDAAAFTGAALQLGHAPAECLFIDDRTTNCEGARGAGMPSIHFDGDVPSLRRQLRERGLL